MTIEWTSIKFDACISFVWQWK